MRVRRRASAQRYVIARARDGTVSCQVEREGRLRPVRHVKLYSSSPALEVGPGSSELALSILADLLGASRTGAAYRQPRGNAAQVWFLHHLVKARFLARLKLARGAEYHLGGEELHRFALAELERMRAARYPGLAELEAAS